MQAMVWESCRSKESRIEGCCDQLTNGKRVACARNANTKLQVGGVALTAYQNRPFADPQKLVERICWSEQRVLTVTSHNNELALRFDRSLMDGCGDRSLRLRELGFDPVLTQVPPGHGRGFVHRPAIALLRGK